MTASAPQQTGKSVSVVTISLNEEGAIAKVISDVKRLLPDAEFVVVDSSTDRTAEIAADLGAVVVKQFPPQGYGKAMDKALKSASGDIVITIDCDDTYPLEAAFELITRINNGADLVSASRLGKRPAAMPLENYCANRLFALLAVLICGVPSTDVHTGMRAYRKSLINNFPYDPNGPALPVELQVGPAALGYRCEEIFIDYRPRVGESKLDRVRSTVWTLKRLWRWRAICNKQRAEIKRQLALPRA